MNKFKTSIRAKLIASFSAVLLIIIAFTSGYFVNREYDEITEKAQEKTQVLSDVLAFSVGAGLSEGSFGLITTATEWVKQDAAVVYAAVLDDSGEPLFVHDPNELNVDLNSAISSGTVAELDEAISAVKPIIYRDENLGQVVMGYSLKSANAAAATALFWASIINIALFGFGIFAITLIIKPITNKIGALRDVAFEVGRGNLRVDIESNSEDEVGQLSASFADMIRNMRTLIEQVQRASQNTSESSQVISAATEQMAVSSQDQSTQAQDVAAAVEEMSLTVRENATRAQETVSSAQNSGKVAEQGGAIIKETVAKIKRISETVNSASGSIKKLGQSSTRIGEIIQVINDIADQTNLLALNAAIEAARAGEQGKGFAVVADEVRKLAERTTSATHEIGGMISTIQTDTQNAVDGITAGSKEVSDGLALADKAGASLEEIVEHSNALILRVNSMASSNEEQATAVQSITQNVEIISNVSQQSAHAVADIAKSTVHLRSESEDLLNITKKFHL